MTISIEFIKELRARTGIGLTDAKDALEANDGDVEKAIEWLKKRGGLKAQKKSSRDAREGVVEAYVHSNGRVGVLAEINCETDFVAKNEKFKELAHDIAMQVAATDPQYVSRDDMPKEVFEKEKEIIRAQLKQEGKSDNIITKALPGRLEKFISEVCLLNQPFIKDEDIIVEELIQQKITVLGENIKVNRFVRFSL